ncbi:Septal ring factor EnvC, activator of murein hydrolases AmiA and AmiB [Lachnospira pectinoschiza]|uniref:Septal ring factor EnvC, activator of murein hydrolases AmiA and AmiB n=2 Tax=Lachnospira pectinoschiza TaxID=28052 RepID=A0A1G9SX58_9FIRM|nr:Septal ring factor EnvC, activator of murein hydrolases AmiA and AmiB [Lachnospira pectinoschiza]
MAGMKFLSGKRSIFKVMGLICKKCALAIMVLALIAPFIATTQIILGDSKSDLEDAKKQQEDVQSKLEETKKYIEDLQGQASDIQSYISSLDSQMETISSSLYELDLQIQDLETTIKTTEEELAKAEEDAKVQYEQMKLRIKFMYEHNDETYLGMLLKAEDMADLLSKAEYINQLSKYDREMLEKYKATIDYIAQTKADLEADKGELVNMQTNLQDQMSALSLLQSTKMTQLTNLNNTVAAEESYYSRLEAENEALEATTRQLEARIKAEEAAKSSVTSYDGGKFKWPTTSTRITSDYGDTEGRSAPHKGIDIGGVKAGVAGDPIYAAYDGKVVISTYSASAGNYIMIYHGDGLYTRYLHCSSLLVSVGDYVTKGQKIGLMGTTGNSTGVHLHFDVRLNGSYVSPWNYLSK